MLPNMSRALKRWQQPITIKKVTQTIADFEPVDNVTTQPPVMAVVQPADLEKIKIDKVDFSLKYYQVHSPIQLTMKDFIVYAGGTYKVVQLGQYNDYGFYEVVVEEVK